jgi:hypothetical protein
MKDNIIIERQKRVINRYIRNRYSNRFMHLKNNKRVENRGLSYLIQ